MGKGRYSIVFNSPTGNTKKLADTIYAVLAKENCDYFGVPKVICTPFTGHPVEGVLLCGTHMSTKGNV